MCSYIDCCKECHLGDCTFLISAFASVNMNKKFGVVSVFGFVFHCLFLALFTELCIIDSCFFYKFVHYFMFYIGF